MADLAYLTPRFPTGIRVSDLGRAEPAVQQETMAFWFLANFAPATGVLFAFDVNPAELPKTSAPATVGGVPLGPAPQFGGLDHGRLIDGGVPHQILLDEFRETVAADIIEATARLFGGLWERRPADPALSQEATDEDVRKAITAALEVFESIISPVGRPEYGGIGHNGPAGEPLTHGERDLVLRAVRNMRLAVTSGADVSVLDAIWSGVSTILAKVGTWAIDQLGRFFNIYTPAAATAFAEASPVIFSSVLLYCAGVPVVELVAALAFLQRKK